MTDQLVSMTLRLPASSAESLRAAAFAARLQPAALARALLVQSIESGELPPPAPPAPAALAPAARQALAALTATASNLAQLKNHAQANPALAGLVTLLVQMAAQTRAIGLSIKTGSDAPVNALVIESAAQLVNSLCRRLNTDSSAVAASDWHAPLSSLRAALAEATQ